MNGSGGSFSLDTYEGVTVSGSFGKTNLPSGQTFYAVDAFGHGTGDIEPWNGTPFPQFSTSGDSPVIYLELQNSSSYNVQFVAQKGKPVWSFTLKDSGGFPGTNCSFALYLQSRSGGYIWQTPIGPPSGEPSGNTVTINWYEWPGGFELPLGTPTYVQFYCDNGSH